MPTADKMINRAVVQAIKTGAGAKRVLRIHPLDWAAMAGIGKGGATFQSDVGTLGVVLNAAVPRGSPRIE